MSERKAGISLSYLSIGIANLIGLIYTPFLLRIMGPSEYGLYALAASVISYLSVMDFGFGNATIRYTASFRAKDKEAELPELWGMLLIIYGMISLISLTAGLWLSMNSETIFSNSMAIEELKRMQLLLLLMTFNITISFPLSIFESILIAYERFKFQRGIQLIRTLLQPIVMIPLLLLGYKSIALVVLITVLNILYLSANLWYSIKKLNIRIQFKRFNIPLLKEIMQYSFWVFLIMIVDRLYWSTGQIILGIFAGTSAVAIFAVALQFKNYLTSFSVAISSVFLPKITAINSNSELNDLFLKIGRIQFIIIAFFLSGFILLGNSFIHLWAGNDYSEAYFIALIILVPLSVPLIQTLGMSVLQAQNKLKFRSYVYLMMAVICCFTSIPLAKIYGGIGCAISISFSLILCNILIMNIYYHKKIGLNIPKFWKEIISMFIPILFLDGFFYIVLKQLSISQSWGSLLLQVLIFSSLYLSVTYKWSINQYERLIISNYLYKFLHLKYGKADKRNDC